MAVQVGCFPSRKKSHLTALLSGDPVSVSLGPSPFQAAGDGDKPPPGAMGPGLSQGCRGCSCLLRALSLLQSPPCSHLPEAWREATGPPICEYPGSLEVGGKIAKTETCSLTSLLWAGGFH